MVSIEIHTLKSGACWIQHNQTREQVRGTSHFQMSYLSIHYLDKGRFYYLQRDLGGSLSTFCHCTEQICLPIFMMDIFNIDHNPCVDLSSQIPSGGSPLSSMLIVYSRKQTTYRGLDHYEFQISETWISSWHPL